MEKLYLFLLALFVWTPLASAQTQVVANASRTSGIAPLTVFFDATGTTNPRVTGRPFHDLEYRWNFGDTSSPMWTRGARAGSSSKNIATGPLAAHVYERPGTYTATVSVFDGTSSVSRQISITVADPNTAFSGTRTVCFSTGARGFGGCPAGAQQVRTSDFAAAINAHRGTGKRLLFRRGETFNSGGTAIINVNGPGLIGAFGATTDPLPVLRRSGSGTAIQLSSGTTPTIRDWRVMDLNLVGSNGTQSFGVSMGGGMGQVTLLRLATQQQRIGVVADYGVTDYYNRSGSTAGHKIWDQLALVDSTVSGVTHSTVVANKGYGTYMAADRLFYAGNYIDNGGTAANDVTHVARFPYLAKSVISNNTLMRPGPGGHVVKLHAPIWGGTSSASRGLGGGYSRWIILSDNKFVGASNPWLVAIGPQNAQNNERVRDVISERNWIVAGPGLQVAEIYFASDVTARNNIVDSSAGSSWQTGISVARRGVEPAPANIRIYNNAYYTASALTSGRFTPIDLGAGVSNVGAWNNVAYAPNSTNPVMVRNGCGGCLTQSNNSTSAQIKSNLPFAVSRPGSPAQFKASGYSVNSGRAVPIWSDFFLASRGTGTQRDLGAVLH